MPPSLPEPLAIMRRSLWSPEDGVPTQNSSASSFTLTRREFKALYNVRVGARSVKVRKPYTFLATTGLTGHVRGARALTINGQRLFFIALSNLGVTNVYVSTGRAFTAVTASSGPYGDTTFTTPATATPSSTNTGTDIVTFAYDPHWVDGHMVGYEATQFGFTKGDTYFAHRVTATTYSFHTNLEDALAGTNKVDITGSVTGKFFPYLSNTVNFEPVREIGTGDPGGGAMYGISGRDLVVMSDGAKVVVYDRAHTGTNGKVALHQKVWHPGAGKVWQESGWSKFISLSQANTTPTGTGGVTATDNSAHPDTLGTTLRMRMAAGTVSGDLAKFAFTTGDTVCSGKQLQIMYDCPENRYLWDSLKVTVSFDDATYYTVYDPSASSFNSPIVTDCEKGFQLASFELDASAVPPATVVKFIKLTYVGATAVASQTDVYVFMVAGGGSVGGGTLFRVSYYNSGSRAESIGVTCDDKLGRSTALHGCQDSRNFVPVPASTLVYYSVFVWFKSFDNTERDKGTDYLLLYGREPRQRTFQYTLSQTLNSYGGSWALTTVQGRSQTASGLAYVVVDDPVYYSRKAPDGLNMPVPPSKSLASMGGRLWTGDSLSQNGSASDTPSDVYFSEQDHPFRFRDILANTDVGVPDPASGGRVVFPGEKVRALAAMNEDPFETGAIAAITEDATYILDGTDSFQLTRPKKAAPFGTLSPWSVVVYNGDVFWLDNFGQVRSLRRGPISRDRVDDQTAFVPRNRLGNVSCHIHNDILRLFYTHSQTATNTRALLYDLERDSWVNDLPAGESATFQFGVTMEKDGEIFNIDENANLVKCEDPDATLDTYVDTTTGGIQPILLLGEVHDSGESKFQYKRIGVVCSVESSKFLDAYWTGRSGKIGYFTGTTYPKINVGGTGVTHAWNQMSGIEDVSAYPAVRSQTAGVASGFEFYSIIGEVIKIPGDKLG